MKKFLQISVAILFCELVGVIGSVFTMSEINTWYATLQQPSFRPPNWLFGPVWTTLYALMGVTLYLLWTNRSSILAIHAKKYRRQALIAFFVQLGLNFIWTPVFFGLHATGVAAIIIVLLWLAIVWTIITSYKVRPLASYLLIPYLAWVSFATVLNITIWWINLLN